MNTAEKEVDILTLKFIGIDSWDRPVYRDQSNRLWKDVTLGSVRPDLCSASGNEFEGEPDEPIRITSTILPDKYVRMEEAV